MIHPLSDECRVALNDALIPMTLPKNYLLLEAPRIADHAYFLVKGFAMCYTYLDGEKLVDGFWKPGQIMLSSNSFFEQVPSMEYIQLMEKSVLLCISYASVERMFTLSPEAHFICRIVMNRYYVQARQRVHDLQRVSARERHQRLLAEFPMIEQHVPQDCIASYLGITPQSLSRLKKSNR